MKKGRLLYIDVIKILAMFLVILLHAAASVFYSVSTNSFSFAIYNFYDTIARSCVPLFVMASGVYFLNNKHKINIKTLYTKYIFRIIIALIISSVIIETIKYMLNPIDITVFAFLKSIIIGDKILWFFYMIIGLYIITPVLREITKSKEITLYLIILFFIFSVFIPTINIFLEFDFLDKLLSNVFTGMFNPSGGFCMVGFYLLGFYLSEYKIDEKYTKTFYILGIVSLIFTFLLTEYYSITSGSADPKFYNYLSLTVFFTPIAIFLFFKDKLNKNVNNSKLLLLLATSTLLIYPIHRMLMLLFSFFNVSMILIKYPFFAIPFYSIMLFVLSFALSFIVRKSVLILKKYSLLRYILYLFLLLLILVI